MERSAIFVLGMHRSGTSAVAGVLSNLFDVYPSDLMPPSSENKKGYFESLSVVALNDSLLQCVGSTWYDYRPIESSAFDGATLDCAKRDAAEVLRKSFGNADVIIVKDPRICRLTPIWLDRVVTDGRKPLAVIPIRPPSDVARSLNNRDCFSKTHGILLWLRHVVDAEYTTRNIDRSYLMIDDFVSDWRNSCQKVASDLRLASKIIIKENDLDSFVDRDLLTTTTEGEIQNSVVVELAEKAYAATRRLAIEPFDPHAMSEMSWIDKQLAIVIPQVHWLVEDCRSSVTCAAKHYLTELMRTTSVLHGELERINAELSRAIDRERHTLNAAAEIRSASSMISAELSAKSAELAKCQGREDEIKHHLDKLNSYGWTKLGLTFDRSLKKIAESLLLRRS